MIKTRTRSIHITEAKNGIILTVNGVESYEQKDGFTNPIRVDSTYVFDSYGDIDGVLLADLIQDINDDLNEKQQDVVGGAVTSPVKRGRGRPRKNAN